MADNVRAMDLALTDFASIDQGQRLAVAMTTLIELQGDPNRPKALIVNDAAGNYVGMLSARLLARVLVADWSPSTEDMSAAALESELLEAVRRRLDLSVGEVLLKDLPKVAPDARLLEMIRATCERRIEYLSVVDGGRATGLVPVTAIFQATASLALTPDDEGIRFDQDKS